MSSTHWCLTVGSYISSWQSNPKIRRPMSIGRARQGGAASGRAPAGPCPGGPTCVSAPSR